MRTCCRHWPASPQCAGTRALSYALGYAAGNDVSHREWQQKRRGGQWSPGKGFDGWAPFGPGTVSSEILKDPQSLRITTKLNGQTVHARYDFLYQRYHRFSFERDNASTW
jgi:2-keto-4-pentenoate hydratase/2-oxohepta-3-ene-1,7-dioic acid hydratase in catechol pathway